MQRIDCKKDRAQIQATEAFKQNDKLFLLILKWMEELNMPTESISSKIEEVYKRLSKTFIDFTPQIDLAKLKSLAYNMLNT